ncbi:MAG: NUDIX domain-containing protein [Spirochaetia bacterium]|nr:NUDIX domain-containing protein [Spirochaetia bacterium]
MEEWDVYSQDRIRTGKIQRGEEIPQGSFRIVVHICIFNTEGTMLIQQRQLSKKSYPNAWDLSVGGCVRAGESSDQAAQREVMEELGISLDLEEHRPHVTIHFEQGFDDYYVIHQDVDVNALELQREEVQQAAWATQAEIHSMIDEGTFIPYHTSLIDLLFSMREIRDSRTHL